MKGATFVAIDVETANRSPASICQIGVCVFVDGAETDCFSWLVNPEDTFDHRNVAIHGITQNDVARHAAFHQVHVDLASWMDDAVIVSHGRFDRTALKAAFAAIGEAPPAHRWLDSCDLVRAAWPAVAERGFGLKPTAERLGIVFDHHDALHDARTAGLILIAAVSTLDLSFDEAMRRFALRGDPPVKPSLPIRRPPADSSGQPREVHHLPSLLTTDQLQLLRCYGLMSSEMKQAYLAMGIAAIAQA